MILNFIFAHMNAIALSVWMVFFVFVLIRFIRPRLVKNISYKWLILGAVALHLFYAFFLTWGQYHIWAAANDFTRSLLLAPLPQEAPLPAILEWTRSYFSHPLGYFVYYAFGRFFFNILMLFTVAGGFYAVLKFWHTRRNNFGEQGPELLCALMLIAGWPGVIVLVPLGFFIAVLFSVGSLVFLKKNEVSLHPAFLVALPVALVGGGAILNILHIYSVLKI